jgi:mRNA interferase HigB
MVVISYRTVREFIEKYPETEDALNNWYAITEKCNWANFHEIKRIFNTVDAVGDALYVFNIRGNHYRLIARIIFRVRTVYIKFIGTHREYDKIDISQL